MQQATQAKTLWGYSELSQYLGRSEDALRRDVMLRQIPFIKISRQVRFDPKEIETWLKESCTHNPEV